MMTSPESVLLLDSNPADRELTKTLLTSALPNARIIEIEDSIALATALTRAPADVAVIAPDLSWASCDKVLALFAREAPTTAIVLFGDAATLNERTLNPGRALDGLVRKDSAGFMALAEVVCSAMPAAAASTPIGIDQLPLAAAFVAEDGHISVANAAFAQRTGLTAPDLINCSVVSLCADEPARETWSQFLSSAASDAKVALATGDALTSIAHIKRDHAREHSSRFLLCLTEPQAPPLSLVATTERAAGNREMHDIALVFSHDLKEPVQQIMRLVHRLDSSRRLEDPTERTRLTTQLNTCAERASAMLDSMLEYLAITARDERPSHVDLNECLEEALDNLRAIIDDNNAEIVSAPLPVIAGDAYQLSHLFQNLIGNAIKFRSHLEPRIRIDVTDAEDHFLIEIADNGIGIAPNFCEQVFDMGKRLHTRDEYPGGGMGLTLCRRIVERHGGRVHIQPGVNGGTVVVINMPQMTGRATRRA